MDNLSFLKRVKAFLLIFHQGFLPKAVVNFLVRLGWSYGDQEVFSLEELIEKFDISHIGKAAAIFDPEKLLWFNAHYIKETPDEILAEMLLPFLRKKGYPSTSIEYVIKIIPSLKPRAKTLIEMADMADFYFLDDITPNAKAKKFLVHEIKPALTEMLKAIEVMPSLNESEIEQIFKEIKTKYDLSTRQFAQAIRAALTGRTASPGLFEIMAIMGRQRVINRIKKALEGL